MSTLHDNEFCGAIPGMDWPEGIVAMAINISFCPYCNEMSLIEGCSLEMGAICTVSTGVWSLAMCCPPGVCLPFSLTQLSTVVETLKKVFVNVHLERHLPTATRPVPQHTELWKCVNKVR